MDQKVLDDLFQEQYIKDFIENVCGEETELIIRPACYMLRAKSENERMVERVIILPPKGFTADKLNMMNSHDEAEYATIEIKGSYRPGKKAFSKIKNCLFIASFYETGKVSELNKPYLTYSLDNHETIDGLSKEMRSAGEPPFSVVKPDGYGFYHNLVNTSDDWLFLKLVKCVRPQKQANVEEVVAGFPDNYATLFVDFYKSVQEYGDTVFKQAPDLIEQVYEAPLEYSLPALFEMLYIFDSGMHEACSVFAVILKIGKQHTDDVITSLQEAIENDRVLPYYANQLIAKLQTYKASSDKKVA